MSKIEWTDITRNPVKGKCPTGCPYCYARAMYDDHKWDPSIRFRPEVIDDIPKKPCRVFVGSTHELFIYHDWLREIFYRCRQHPDHTFIFLTKQPQELPRWSPFPDNFEVGVSATNRQQYYDALRELGETIAPVKFISFEPLIENIIQRQLSEEHLWRSKGVGGAIIGAMTGRKGKLLKLQNDMYPQLQIEKMDAVGRKYTLLPQLNWVKDIVATADIAGASVFLKDNLYKLAMECPAEDHDFYWADMANLRQELPRKAVRV